MVMEIALICGSIFSSVTFVQAFLLEFGLKGTSIGLLGFTGQIFLILGYLIFLGENTSKSRLKGMYGKTTLFFCTVPVILIGTGLAASGSGPSGRLFGLAAIFAGTALQNFIAAYNMIISNRFFIKVIRIEHCGQIFGISGVVGNAFGAAVSFLSAALMKSRGYPEGYYAVFGISIIFYFINAAVILKFRMLFESFEDNGQLEKYVGRKGKMRFLNLKKLFADNTDIRKLILPNLLRGIGAAGPYYIMTIGKKNLDLTAVHTSYVATVILAGTILGNLIFSILISRHSSGKVIFGGALFSAFSLLLVSVSGSSALFLAFNFILVLGQIHFDIGIPTGIYRNYPEHMLGVVTGIRMFLMSVGSACSILAAGYFIDNVGILPVISVIVFIQAISGYYFKKLLVH